MSSPHLESIVRYIKIDETLSTSGQPSEDELAAVAADGFSVVINLALHDDPRYSLPDEAATVAQLGMEYIHIPVPFSAPTAQHFTDFCAAMQRCGSRKRFIHCAANKRVPVFIALYRITKLGWQQADALAAMQKAWQPDERWQAFIDHILSQH